MKKRLPKACLVCGASFWKPKRHTQTCSQSCFIAYQSLRQMDRQPEELSELFHTGYTVDPQTECWNWRRTKGCPRGYAAFNWRGTRYLAHRVSLQLDGRPPAAGQVACHHCDNPGCVNPKHLYPGTAFQNMADAKERGRLVVRRGEQNHLSKLTSEAVRAIRESSETTAYLARQYGVTWQNIDYVRRGITWAHIGGIEPA